MLRWRWQYNLLRSSLTGRRLVRVMAQAAEEIGQADDLLELVRAPQSRAHGILDKAPRKLGTFAPPSELSRRLGRLAPLVKLLGEMKLLGELDERPLTRVW